MLATNDQSAHHYVELKKEKAIEYGVNVIVEKLNQNAKTKDCINIISKWNNDEQIDGILVQIPLFKHIDKFRVLNSVKVSKDVDGLSAHMQGMVNQLIKY
ncbi:MAG: hypothetical protein KatS3mg085_579 [Candidatus Dojkabacteria bacterium]|nr:MAG: hypothetical protein KatS3mg085_579 [Candidatus Dojkabacteria bacterium]